MTQDPHRSPWDPPERTEERHPDLPSSGQPVEPSAQGQGAPDPDHQPTSGYGPPGGYYGAQGGQPAPPEHSGHPGYRGYPPPPGYPAHAGSTAAPPAQHGYSGVPAGQAPPAPASAIVLLVISGILTLVLSWTLVGLAYVAPAVLGVVALTRHRDDPAGAKRLARTGWVVFWVVTAVLVLLVAALVAVLVAFGSAGAGGFEGTTI